VINIIKFKDRAEAGVLLAEHLKRKIRSFDNSVILAIPRGGIPLAYNIASLFNIKFSMIITKKLAPESNPEYGFGAIAPDGTFLISERTAKFMQIPQDKLKQIKKNALSEIYKRIEKYLDGKQPDLKNKVVIIIDDGIATGYTAMVAGKYAKNMGAIKIILGTPVAPLSSLNEAKKIFDEIVCINIIETLQFAVGYYYDDFHQVSDEEMFEYIRQAKEKGFYYDGFVEDSMNYMPIDQIT
jgi:predicted phosphoribosyltransferase